MPSASNSVFNRQLSSEERQQVRDLRHHQGYQLVVQAIQVLMEQALKDMLAAEDLQATFRSQGRFTGLREVLSIPEKLAAPPTDRGDNT